MAKSFCRLMGKNRALYSYDVLNNFAFEEVNDSETEEIYDFLRTKIAMLSEIYRNIIILYYYDGLSTKEISDKLNIPEGTVTWRLSEGRKKIKKEFEEMNETALHPVLIYGNEWSYIGYMETGKHKRIKIDLQHNANLNSCGVFSHTVFNSISGITFRFMMYDYYINVCQNIIFNGQINDIDSLANAIKVDISLNEMMEVSL